MRIQGTRAFTLVELLIVLGIIGILATASIVLLNPAEYLRQSRDTQRIKDLDSIAIQLTNLVYSEKRITFGTVNKVYISLADSSSTCGTYSLPSLPGSYTYSCVTSSNLTKVDGNGWIPINFSTFKVFSGMPIDPTNDSTYFYEAAFNSRGIFILRAKLESTKKRSDFGAKDGGEDNTKYEVGLTSSLSSL